MADSDSSPDADFLSGSLVNIADSPSFTQAGTATASNFPTIFGNVLSSSIAGLTAVLPAILKPSTGANAGTSNLVLYGSIAVVGLLVIVIIARS